MTQWLLSQLLCSGPISADLVWIRTFDPSNLKQARYHCPNESLISSFQGENYCNHAFNTSYSSMLGASYPGIIDRFKTPIILDS